MCSLAESLSVKEKHRMKFVLLNAHRLSAPWHPSALQGERLVIVFSKSSQATVPEQIDDFYALHLTIWQYLLKSLVCFRTIV